MSTITVKDLTKEFPRSPFDTSLGGFPWLARMTDKARATTAGKMGEYTPFPCGGDKNFLGTVGIDPDAFKAQIDAGKTDEEIAAWVKANVAPGHEEKLAAYIESQKNGFPPGSEYQGYLDGSIAELKAARPELKTDGIRNFAQLICVEEGHHFPY